MPRPRDPEARSPSPHSGRRRRRFRARLAVLGAALAAAGLPLPGPAAAQEPPRPDETVRRDLFAVITLEGLPCGEVVRAERLGENDYLAICESGDRYRVRISEDERVVVERR